jgi:hypothetical protein
VGERERPGEQRIVQAKAADGFNDSRKHKSEGQDQRGAIVGTALAA